MHAEDRPGARGVLVTGGQRSGTTWVGSMLCLAPGISYVHEPFNPLTPPGISPARFDRFFQYVCADNEGPYLAPMRRTLELRYDAGSQLRALRTPRDLARSARDWRAFARGRRAGDRPLMKDPIAFFSSEWLADRFGLEVVVCVRHPAAFASSLKRLNWSHDFATTLAQPLLMRDLLAPFADEIRSYAERPRSIVEQASLLWRMVYATALDFRARHSDWVFVRHEDLSRDPLGGYAALYERLGLTWSDGARAAIGAASAADNPAEQRSKHDVRLDSQAAITSWKRRLSEQEIDTIKGSTADVAAAFYGSEDW